MEKSRGNILVTGATGFIGSHTIVELLGEGYSVIGIDNLINSSERVIERIKELSGKEFTFFKIDIRDFGQLDKLISSHRIDAVMHFAGYKAVGESVKEPMLYFSNNLKGTVNLLEVMEKHNLKKFVFSSSCTVYGNPQSVPVSESEKKSPQNPYGRTKAWIDEMLNDLYLSDKKNWSIISLRYFNPIGAHPSGKIGEDPEGIPNNLLPYITQTAIGTREELSIFGNDYPTPDGTCIRDYIHIVDLSEGHVKALNKILNDIDCNSLEYVNLGTGKGYSVLEVVDTFIEVNNQNVQYKFTPRREGDAAIIYADPTKAKSYLNWEASKTLKDMLRDAWNFQKKNPKSIIKQI